MVFLLLFLQDAVQIVLIGGLLNDAGCVVQVGGVGAGAAHLSDGLLHDSLNEALQVGLGELLLLLLFLLLLAQGLFDGCINGLLDKIRGDLLVLCLGDGGGGLLGMLAQGLCCHRSRSLFSAWPPGARYSWSS